MSEPLFSPSWYRVANLRPRLRKHAKIHRHRYRGQIWYVIHDTTTEQFHRLTPAGYYLTALMDGRRTVQEIWELALKHAGDDAPTQDQMIQLLGQLHAADVLQCNISPDIEELFRRSAQYRRRIWRSRLLSVFSWRFPLYDPERFLQRLLPWVRPLCDWTGVILWFLVVGPAAILAGVHWSALTENMLDRLMTPQNLFAMWLLFPILKLFHELGHGLAVKRFGGEVHDIGLMILVLTPVPYVDASSAWGFRNKWQRIVVGAAGMAVELFLAATALYIWISVEPGVVRTIAFNTMAIAGISTILFNANPLLRFDGYYIFSDLLEIPNLRNRSNRYLGYLAERYLFGRREAEPPPTTKGERGWFVGYGIAAFFYRIFIMIVIVLFLLEHYFLLGVLLGGFAVIMWVGVPLGKGMAFLLTNPRIRQVRLRAIGVSCLLLITLVALIGFVPVPFRTVAEGVIWLPDEAYVRAREDSFINQIVAFHGQTVKPGDVLIRGVNPELSTRVQVLQARVEELEAQFLEYWPEDRVQAAIVQDELVVAHQELQLLQMREAALVITSQTSGTFVLPHAHELPGRYVRRGEELGYVVDLNSRLVRAIIAQDDINLVQGQVSRVEARLAERLAKIMPAIIVRMVPMATDELPSLALSREGGGSLLLDPGESKMPRAIQKFFLVDLELSNTPHLINAGGRVYLLFDHGRAPLVAQWGRAIRQLFLARFNV